MRELKYKDNRVSLKYKESTLNKENLGLYINCSIIK